MFRAFSLEVSAAVPTAYSFLPSSVAARALHEQQGERVRQAIGSWLNAKGQIDAWGLMGAWFKPLKADIFLSHSHQDEDLAIRLGAWINERFGLSCFIDSIAWGYSNQLLREIDNAFCLSDTPSTYDYDKRNRSTAHVHAMLIGALMRLMDETECAFFVRTPSSIAVSEAIGQATGTTLSPWLYSELSLTRLIRRRSSADHRGLLKKALSRTDAARNLEVAYSVPLDHLTALTAADLLNWTASQVEEMHPLDVLYGLHPA